MDVYTIRSPLDSEILDFVKLLPSRTVEFPIVAEDAPFEVFKVGFLNSIFVSGKLLLPF
jgi:hypothetical protein